MTDEKEEKNHSDKMILILVIVFILLFAFLGFILPLLLY